MAQFITFVFLAIFCTAFVSHAKKTKKPKPGVTNQPDEVQSTDDTLPGLLGPVPLNRYVGSGVTASQASDLNCDFTFPCCWSNVGPPKDNLEWVTASGVPDTSKFSNLFGNAQIPQGNYLITSSAAGASTSYGILNSCSMQCQSDTGTLTLKKWTSPQVNLDVCILPVGSDQFSYCQTISDPGPDVTVTIPPQSGPFQIVIAASNFVLPPGGAAIVDDISYQSTITDTCSPTAIFTTVTAPIVIVPSSVVPVSPTALCSAISCNFAGTLCGYNGASGTCPFTARTGETGCWAGGIRNGPGGGPYCGAELGPTAKAVLQSPTFTADLPFQVKFKYFNGPYGTTLKGCVDNESNCPFTSSIQSFDASTRQWQDGVLDVPAGTHSIFFTATNSGGENAGVGIANIGLNSYGGQPVTC